MKTVFECNDTADLLVLRDYLLRVFPLHNSTFDVNQSIDSLELTIRSSMALRSNGVTSIHDLIKLRPSDILKFPNFGRKSFNEVLNALTVRGLSLVSL